MKPRNRFEKAVLAQSGRLRPITRAQVKWAFKECIDHFAFRLPSGRTTCMDCGHSWKMETPTTHCNCPVCGTKLQVEQTFVRKVRQKSYFTVLTKCGEYQVLRMYLLIVEMEKGCQAHPYALEIGHYWWNAQGKTALVAIQRTLGRYMDCFSFSSPKAIRPDNVVYRYIANAPLYPKCDVIPTLRRNGFNRVACDMEISELIPALLSDAKAETLMKTGQYAFLRHYLTARIDMDKYWASVKICIRNGYVIPDGSTWCDTIDLLRSFGKDTHNPKYVCPADLKTEHDRLVLRRNRLLERERLAERRKEAVKLEETYRKLKGRFFGIVITDGTLNVRVLESVAEFAEEAALMHHCVWANAYYLKENSLILSATIGRRHVETVEVDLQTLKVVQSRGVCNSNTEYHDRIVSLVNSNMNLIRQRMGAA